MADNTGRAPERLRQRLVIGIGLAFAAGGVAMFLNQTLVFSGCVSLILTLATALGCVKNDSVGPYRWYLSAALLVWLAAFTGMHLLPTSTETLVLGFVPATAVAIYGLWLLPFFLVTLPYALHFDSYTLTPKDWERLAPFARKDKP